MSESIPEQLTIDDMKFVQTQILTPALVSRGRPQLSNVTSRLRTRLNGETLPFLPDHVVELLRRATR